MKNPKYDCPCTKRTDCKRTTTCKKTCKDWKEYEEKCREYDELVKKNKAYDDLVKAYSQETYDRVGKVLKHHQRSKKEYKVLRKPN